MQKPVSTCTSANTTKHHPVMDPAADQPEANIVAVAESQIEANQ